MIKAVFFLRSNKFSEFTPPLHSPGGLISGASFSILTLAVLLLTACQSNGKDLEKFNNIQIEYVPVTQLRSTNLLTRAECFRIEDQLWTSGQLRPTNLMAQASGANINYRINTGADCACYFNQDAVNIFNSLPTNNSIMGKTGCYTPVIVISQRHADFMPNRSLQMAPMHFDLIDTDYKMGSIDLK